MKTALLSLFSNFTFPSLNGFYLTDNATSSRSFLSSLDDVYDDDSILRVDMSSRNIPDDSLVIARPFTLSINYSSSAMVAVTVLLTFMVLATAFGNFLVGLALFRYRSLRTVSNILIGNLALSDFLLAATILPLSTINECLGRWVFGRFMCNLWLSLDVLYCTASIWNLCVIALDRYTATVYPLWYREKRSVKQAICYIVLVWFVSLLICVPPVLGWGELEQNFVFDNSTRTYQCVLFQSPGYVLYSASGSFYIPFVITLFMYIRIFALLRARSKALRVAREASRKAALKSRRHGVTDLQASTQSRSACNNPGGIKNGVSNASSPCVCSNNSKQEIYVFSGSFYKNQGVGHDSNRLSSNHEYAQARLVSENSCIQLESKCIAECLEGYASQTTCRGDSGHGLTPKSNNISSQQVSEVRFLKADGNDAVYHQLSKDSENCLDKSCIAAAQPNNDGEESNKDSNTQSSYKKCEENILSEKRTILVESNPNSIESDRNMNKNLNTLAQTEVQDSICPTTALCKKQSIFNDDYCSLCKCKIKSFQTSSNEPTMDGFVNHPPINCDINTAPVSSDDINTNLRIANRYRKIGFFNENQIAGHNNMNGSLKTRPKGRMCDAEIEAKKYEAKSCLLLNHSTVNEAWCDGCKCTCIPVFSADDKWNRVNSTSASHTDLLYFQLHDRLPHQSNSEFLSRPDCRKFKQQSHNKPDYKDPVSSNTSNIVGSDDNSNVTLLKINDSESKKVDMCTNPFSPEIPTILYSTDHLTVSYGSDNNMPSYSGDASCSISAVDMDSEIQQSILSNVISKNCLSVPNNLNLSKFNSLKYSRSFRPPRRHQLSLGDICEPVDDYEPVKTSKSKKSKYEDRAEEMIESRLHKKFMQRELRATLRMSIIISMFCFMWIGFFIVYVIRGWCNPRQCHVPRQLEAFFFWLGYSNSSLNPVLYTLFNEDFRKAFRTILLHKKNRSFSQSSSRARRPTDRFTFRRSIFT